MNKVQMSLDGVKGENSRAGRVICSDKSVVVGNKYRLEGSDGVMLRR